MTFTLGPLIFTFEYKSRNFRKQVEAELARGLIYAVKKARELRPGMTLKAAVDYVKALPSYKERSV